MNLSLRWSAMKLRFDCLWPDSMLNQILVLLSAAGVFMVLIGAVTFLFVKQAYDNTSAVMNSHLVSVAIAKLNETPPIERAEVLQTLQQELPDVAISWADDAVLSDYGGASEGERFGPFITGDTLFGMRIEHVLGPHERGLEKPPLVFVRLKDGSLLAAEWGPRGPPPSVLGAPFYLFFGFLALTLCGLLIWAARSLVGPLADLAASVSRFGEASTSPVPISEGGPKEVRAAASAFNRMQLRINAFLETRTRMLTAVSHDLRTPLTRLRLRLDLLEDGEVRERSLQDLRQMELQIDSALTFLRDGESAEPMQRIDLPSFLQTLADQYADTGRGLRIRFDGSLSVMGRASELIRAFCNLIDNALQYGAELEILAWCTGDRVQIDFVDHGPGIAADDRERLLEPFERGDFARRIREGTGFGLGLPTAKSIVEVADGRLELLETPGGGLTVSLSLPLAP